MLAGPDPATEKKARPKTVDVMVGAGEGRAKLQATATHYIQKCQRQMLAGDFNSAISQITRQLYRIACQKQHRPC